jgi:hypothetical protein
MTGVEHPFIEPEGPLVYTFTCLLPFTLGLPDQSDRLLRVLGDWADPSAADDYGAPYVRIRLHNEPIDGLDLFPSKAHKVIEAFYGEQPAELFPALPLYGAGIAYEQWVTMETPGSRLASEPIEEGDGDTGPYAFHRCLRALNAFLAAHVTVFKEPSVRPIDPHALGAFMFRGAFSTDGTWHYLGPMMMLFEAWPVFLRYDADPRQDLLGEAIRVVVQKHPAVEPHLWFNRSERASKRGDQVDRVISLQTAVEITLYGLLQMILVDLGASSVEIDSAITGTDFKPLVVTWLPRHLGGRWDVTARATPIGLYWVDVYALRNRAVHAGYTPSVAEGDAARNAYTELWSFLNERVWERRRQFPRTTMARIAEPARFGWQDLWFDELKARVAKEPEPWWWPADQAGRPAPR